MATATLNGAIESGLNAARCAVGYLEKVAVRTLAMYCFRKWCKWLI
jgi:hypothetical protein